MWTVQIKLTKNIPKRNAHKLELSTNECSDGSVKIVTIANRGGQGLGTILQQCKQI